MIRDPIYSIFGDTVRRRRKEEGLTLENLALTSGLSLTRSAISNIEQGRQQVSIHQFLQLCKAVDIDPVAMIKELSEPGKTPYESGRLSEDTRSYIQNV